LKLANHPFTEPKSIKGNPQVLNNIILEKGPLSTYPMWGVEWFCQFAILT